MSADESVKALLLAVVSHANPAVYTINRLTPEHLCFFLPDSSKTLVEQEIQPHITKLPRRWDWITTEASEDFSASHRILAGQLPELLKTWEIQEGELVLDLTGATPSMAAAMALVGLPATSKIIMLAEGSLSRSSSEEVVFVDNHERLWTQGNPWDEEARRVQSEAGKCFNRCAFGPAGELFHHLAARVSGSLKPLYRAFGDLSEGYAHWEQFLYRPAWDKLKTALKALELASVWGGPSSLKTFLPSVKSNTGFLEKLVLDPLPVKLTLAHDLLAHAKRRADLDRNFETATIALVRALEAFAQYQLFKNHKIKTWDVQPEQLPQNLRESCRSCYLDDLDGKYKLPLHAQFRTLAGVGDTMGQTYLANWAKMKPLFDAASHAVLGHGFESIKAERFHQLYDLTVKLTAISDASLPKFPVMRL